MVCHGNTNNIGVGLEKNKSGTSNPCYSGDKSSGRSWFKASLGKYFVRHYLEKNPSQKRAGGVALGVGHEFKC
jgi:hypothetical protein